MTTCQEIDNHIDCDVVVKFIDCLPVRKATQGCLFNQFAQSSIKLFVLKFKLFELNLSIADAPQEIGLGARERDVPLLNNVANLGVLEPFEGQDLAGFIGAERERWLEVGCLAPWDMNIVDCYEVAELAEVFKVGRSSR